MELRTATMDDFDVLFSAYREIVEVLEKRFFDEGFYRDMLRKAISEKRSLVAEQDGGIVGFIEYNPAPPNLPMLRENAVWVEWVWVHSDHRGKGVGRKLYEYLFDYAKKQGFARVGLDVFTVNTDSRAFHEKIGFVEKIQIFIKDL